MTSIFAPEHALAAESREQIKIPRVRNRLGGSHTVVTYPPLDALSIDTNASAIETAIAPCDNLNLYFHIVFCEYICHFCHYTKVFSPIGDIHEAVDRYINALCLELDARSDVLRGSRVSSIYLGGGTPTSIRAEYLERLLIAIRHNISDDARNFCIETSPRSVIEDDCAMKLRLAQSLGLNRLSIGVQSFDDQLLLRYRGHNQHVVLRALDSVSNLGISWNLDLIQDLPGQTQEMIEKDLSFIESYKPDQVTWYILRPETEASWYKSIARGNLTDLPSSSESIERRITIIKAMIDLGYRPEAGGRFQSKSSHSDEYKRVRNDSSAALLGFGASAYSHGWGYFFRNYTDHKLKNGIKEYVRSVEEKSSRIWKSFRLSKTELAAGRRVNGVRDFLAFEDPSQNDVDAIDAERTTALLVNAGYLKAGAKGCDLTLKGRAVEEEITSLFYSRHVKSILARRDRYWPFSTEYSAFGQSVFPELERASLEMSS